MLRSMRTTIPPIAAPDSAIGLTVIRWATSRTNSLFSIAVAVFSMAYFCPTTNNSRTTMLAPISAISIQNERIKSGAAKRCVSSMLRSTKRPSSRAGTLAR